MSRELDVKALISHIVRGDGADKCRICMGDTSEGQVYLGDTVMMDGERPVTLAELLEMITGVEVTEADNLPNSICSVCSGSAVDAARFSILCRQSDTHWNTTVQLLETLQLPKTFSKHNKAIFVIIHNDQLTVLDDYVYDEKVPLNKDGVHMSAAAKKKIHHRLNNIRCQCQSCGKRFRNAYQLSLHLKDSIDLTRACHICAKVMTRDCLIKHLSEDHLVEPYDCKLCPALLYTYDLLTKHMTRVHSEGTCTCGECGRSFKSEHALRAHQVVHSMQTCPGCNKLFKNLSCYVYHVKRCCDLDKNRKDTHFTKNKVTVEVKNKISDKKIRVGLRGSAQRECICDYCGKKFAGKKFVGAHIQIVHLKNTHRPCSYCGKLLASAHMTEHVKSHEQVRSYTCEHCKMKFKTKLGYVQHLRLHTGEKPYACKFCGETFSASSRRSHHVRKVHTQITHKYACQFCPAKFLKPFLLRKHVAAVHAEGGDSSVTHKCDICHAVVGSVRGLVYHKRMHQDGGLKPRKKYFHVKPFADTKLMEK